MSDVVMINGSDALGLTPWCARSRRRHVRKMWEDGVSGSTRLPTTWC